MRKRLPRTLIALISAGLFVISPVIFIRVIMSPYLFSHAANIPAAAVVLIPGASVIRGEPSPILALRADLGASLYREHRVEKILITGDNTAHDYDEVTPMFNYLRASNIDEKDMVTDREGYNTFTSMYHAKNLLNIDSVIIVTQDFHLPRAVFLARALGIQAYGLATEHGGTFFDYAREIPASWKALFDLLLYHSANDAAFHPAIAVSSLSRI